MTTTILSATIYAAELSSSGRGIPLWYPEPSSTGEIQIGDVGFLHNGGFLRLFNATVPASHPWNSKGVPDNYEPMVADLTDLITDDRAFDLPQGVLGSSSIKSVQAEAIVQGQVPGQPAGLGLRFDFELNSRQGAILVLKDYATRKTVIAQKLFVSYMKANIEHWAAYADRRGTDYKQEDLLFVNGWTKTTAWHIAAFHESSKSYSGSIKGQVSAAVGAAIAISTSGRDSMKIEERCGPNELYMKAYGASAPPRDTDIGDQCIFLVAYKAKRRSFWLGLKIFAAAGHHRLPDPANDRDVLGAAIEVEASSMPADEIRPGSFPFTGPCDAVLDFILKNSHADIAIASEVDIDDLFCGEDWPDDIAKYLDEHAPEVEVEDGVGSLSLKATVNRALMHDRRDRMYDEDGEETRIRKVEAGTLEIHGSSPNPMPWRHSVLHEPWKDMEQLTCMFVSRTGPFVAVGSQEGSVGVWNYKNDELVHMTHADEDSVWAVAISYDGTKLASGGADGLGIIWDIVESLKVSVLDAHNEDIVSIAWSPDGKFIATGSVDSTARLWNPDSSELLQTFSIHEATVQLVDFSPDSKRVVTFTEAVGHIWDAASGDHLHMLSGHESIIWWMSISSDDGRIATCSEDGTARIWSVETGEELTVLTQHTGAVYSVMFSPDGKEVASGSFDGTVVTCDSFSADRHHTFDKHPSAVNAITYSHSGRFIASGSFDGYVKVWDTLREDFLAEFRGHKGPVKRIAFSWDDKVVVSSSEDGTIRVWSLRDALRFV